MRLTYRPAGAPRRFAVRSLQFLPPSAVTHSLPSSVPAHTCPACFADSVSATTVQCVSAPDPPVSSFFGSIVLRSGLAISQRLPRSSRRNTWLPPSHSTLGSCGEIRNGVFQLKRKRASPSLFEGLRLRSRWLFRSRRLR